MKRITKYRIVNLTILLSYLVVLGIKNATNFFAYQGNLFYFICTLLAIGISLIFKCIIFKSDSSLWIGIFCIGIAIMLLTIEWRNLDFKVYWVMLTIAPVIASIVAFIFFHDIVQLRFIFYNLLFAIPFWFSSFGFMPLWSAFIIDIIWIIILLLYNIVWNKKYKK